MWSAGRGRSLPAMADPLHYRESKPRSGRRWVKVVGIVVLIVILVVVAVMLIGGGVGGHGPSRHTGSGGQASAVNLAEV
jgi:hypothetical protein